MSGFESIFEILESLQRSKAIVPAIWSLEVGNVMLAAERRGRLSEADSTIFLSMFSSLPIYSEPETRQRAMSNILFLARVQQLSTYDASYLDLAMRHRIYFQEMHACKTRPQIYDPKYIINHNQH